MTNCIKSIIEECPLSAAKLASTFSKWELFTAAATVALKQEAPLADLIAIFELADDTSALLALLAKEAKTMQYFEVMRGLKRRSYIRLTTQQARAIVLEHPDLLLTAVRFQPPTISAPVP